MACNFSKPCLRINYTQRVKTYTVLTLYLTCVSKQDSGQNPIEYDNVTFYS
jgi:hypothetical protein